MLLHSFVINLENDPLVQEAVKILPEQSSLISFCLDMAKRVRIF